ncbi:patj [Carabus blaptoides fortunei]
MRNLSNGDKILAIDGKPLDTNISHQQAMSILQKARGLVELVVARTGPDEEESIHRSPSVVSDASKTSSDMMLNSEWAQVEAIELVNDGTGLGFGIIGGRTMGVVVKTILPGGVADRDGRLQSGDHILQIGEVNLHEMGSEQVATVLRQSGTHVRLVVARPADPTSSEYKQISSCAPLVPTRLLNEPAELDRYLIQHGYPEIFNRHITDKYADHYLFEKADRTSGLSRMSASPSLPLLNLDMELAMPEMEKFTVELKKDINGLGITIAGYVCEKEELSGIFVKSMADHYKERYLRGPKYEQLQQAIAANEMKPSPEPPLPLSQSSLAARYTVAEDADFLIESACDEDIVETQNMQLELLRNVQFSAELTHVVEESIKSNWQKLMGPSTEIVIAQLQKFGEGGGLGISLEGTVDVEDGQEVRPHHYIRSILPEGPVGKNGTLKSGDELLEVNGHRLLGMNHLENLLPTTDRLVKAKSDGSLATSIVATGEGMFSKMKSRSLEPLTGLAMWSSEPQIIELIKGERGLGFSILDYQDPIDPNDTVIVIRSLVPGGVAQLDGRLIPGDRLLFVNDTVLENASLDQAVQALKGAAKACVSVFEVNSMCIRTTVSRTSNALQRLHYGRKHQTFRCSKYAFNDDFRENLQIHC